MSFWKYHSRSPLPLIFFQFFTFLVNSLTKYFNFIIIIFLHITKFISFQYHEILLSPGLDTPSLAPSICTLLVGILLLYMSSNILTKPSALLSTHEYTGTCAHTQTHISDVYVKADVPNFHTLSSQWQPEKNSRQWVKEKKRCIFGTWRMTPKAEVREREYCKNIVSARKLI